jgi:16S rRNA processing protein RimM
MTAEPGDRVTVGRIERPFGVRGDVKVRSLSDVPGRIESLGAVTVVAVDGTIWETRVTHVRRADPGFIIGLEGLANPEDAGRWRGGLIQIPKGSAPPLPTGQYYECDLVGLAVEDEQGRRLGTLTEIWELPGHHVFVVTDGTKELLLPAAKDIVVGVDVARGTMTVRMIEGLGE